MWLQRKIGTGGTSCAGLLSVTKGKMVFKQGLDEKNWILEVLPGRVPNHESWSNVHSNKRTVSAPVYEVKRGPL